MPQPRKILVLNAGHGGPDPGAVGPSGLKEVEVNEAVCNYVSHYIPPLLSVVQAQQTKTAKKGGLREVVDSSNSLNPAIFISVHCNSSINKNAQGLQVYYANSPTSARLARLVFTEIADILENETKWSKLASASYYVLKHSTARAAILIELDFISNLAIEKLMRTKSWQQDAAKAIIEGIRLHTGMW